MNATDIVRNELLAELKLGVRTMEGLLKKVKEKDWEYRLADNMRNLQELAKHVVSILEVDLNIWKEKDRATIQRLEAKYDKLESTDAMIEAMYYGFDCYKAYMLSLSEQEFLTKKTKPFYLEEGEIQAHWLIEDVSHFFHHRGQFFNYLKQLGYDINMFNLYV
ncbi:damage-inducible protein DinB [Virgibacillus profundi]|uniref:Damage-inducible protein DinB n=1 Tax=Virgibacillus profundi TaxID=2024555 RepID=A0A2A2IAN4_9BACI|nr:DinB family protein [Virgibacillus profundi]PAV28687.1 damage-inducible protein DinB [Virgibacillus profundi]PXY52855.1 damage-inducible protein DinB [Virgibacillus profundi]